MKPTIYAAVDHIQERLTSISQFIGNNPELGHEEFKASARLIEELETQGFEVERKPLDIPTAFIGTYKAAKPGPKVGFLCEYDALPDVGHACGHHLICTMSLGAAVGLKAVIDEIGGEIYVYGTPAEETAGAKVTMADAGLFNHLDFALMAHPYYTYESSGTSMAMDALQFEFFGKPAHAAANPHEGINALDAVIQLFNSINSLRQQVPSYARIHGIISEGGKAPNVIPDYAVANFYVRSKNRPETDALSQRVIRCAEGAAMQTGCTLKVSNYEFSYDELITNRTLSDTFEDNLALLGVAKDEIQQGQDHGSLDLGNVSRRCPTIHPFMKVIDERHMLHSREFRDLAMTDRAMQGMLLTAKVLAATAYDVMSQPALLERIRREFERTVQA